MGQRCYAAISVLPHFGSILHHLIAANLGVRDKSPSIRVAGWRLTGNRARTPKPAASGADLFRTGEVANREPGVNGHARAVMAEYRLIGKS